MPENRKIQEYGIYEKWPSGAMGQRNSHISGSKLRKERQKRPRPLDLLERTGQLSEKDPFGTSSLFLVRAGLRTAVFSAPWKTCQILHCFLIGHGQNVKNRVQQGFHAGLLGPSCHLDHDMHATHDTTDTMHMVKTVILAENGHILGLNWHHFK